MKKLKALLPMLAVIILASCGTPKTANTLTTYVDKGVSASKVEKSIVAAATELGWVTRNTGNNTIQAKLNVRTHEAVINIKYTADSYTITYVSSKNLKYNPTTGAIHPKYNKWIDNLDQHIRMELERR